MLEKRSVTLDLMQITAKNRESFTQENKLFAVDITAILTLTVNGRVMLRLTD